MRCNWFWEFTAKLGYVTFHPMEHGSLMDFPFGKRSPHLRRVKFKEQKKKKIVANDPALEAC